MKWHWQTKCSPFFLQLHKIAHAWGSPSLQTRGRLVPHVMLPHMKAHAELHNKFTHHIFQRVFKMMCCCSSNSSDERIPLYVAYTRWHACAVVLSAGSADSSSKRTTCPCAVRQWCLKLHSLWAGACHLLLATYSGTFDKGPSEIGTTSLQRTLVSIP